MAGARQPVAALLTGLPWAGLVLGGVRGGQDGVQVPGREGLADLAGRVGDGQDVPGGLGGDRRVRFLGGTGFR